MDELQSIYYQPSHLWKGQKAIRKLRELKKEKSTVIKLWLSRQAFWQVHSPPPKHVDRSHYEVMLPNEMQQLDLLYMPSDTLYRNKYKYVLSGVEVASRCKVTRPLRTKQAKDIANMIADIYKVGPLSYPKVFHCDNGSEFKGYQDKIPLDKTPLDKIPQTKSPLGKIPLGQNPPGQVPPSIIYILLTVIYFINSSAKLVQP